MQPPEHAPAHVPVLRDEIVELLLPAQRLDAVEPGSPLRLVDVTLGAGGHTAALLEAGAGRIEVLGLDRDPAALALARSRLAGEPGFSADAARFSELAAALARRGWSQIDGLVADLGVSSMQLDTADRGFAFRLSGPLDMRMDPATGESARDLLARVEASELAQILRIFGEEPAAGRIARAVIRAREQGALPESTTALRDLVARVVGGARHARPGVDPATRTFQALRIAVNQELDELESLLETLPTVLAPGARVAILAYHSLEDRLVKALFRQWGTACTCPPALPQCVCGGRAAARVIRVRAKAASPDEVERNRRSRSARLRALEWVGGR